MAGVVWVMPSHPDLQLRPQMNNWPPPENSRPNFRMCISIRTWPKITTKLISSRASFRIAEAILTFMSTSDWYVNVPCLRIVCISTTRIAIACPAVVPPSPFARLQTCFSVVAFLIFKQRRKVTFALVWVATWVVARVSIC